ncbi:hypothetical protein [Methylobacter svalbardensis]|uniref:hypothetical protein n=1 Tax=Methylobacter svalbardensis TaxID=3080016 RepID=UPI0030EF78B9
MKNANIMKSNQPNENYLNTSKVLVVNPTTEDLTNKFYAAGPNVRIGDALFTVCQSSYYSDDNDHNDHIELHRRADWIASALNAYRVAENNASDVGIKDAPRKIILEQHAYLHSDLYQASAHFEGGESGELMVYWDLIAYTFDDENNVESEVAAECNWDEPSFVWHQSDGWIFDRSQGDNPNKFEFVEYSDDYDNLSDAA